MLWTIKNHQSLPAGSKSLQRWIYQPIISVFFIVCFSFCFLCLSFFLFFHSLIWAVKLKSPLPSDLSPQVRNRAGSHPVKSFLFPWPACLELTIWRARRWPETSSKPGLHQSGTVRPTGGKTLPCIAFASTLGLIDTHRLHKHDKVMSPGWREDENNRMRAMTIWVIFLRGYKQPRKHYIWLNITINRTTLWSTIRLFWPSFSINAIKTNKSVLTVFYLDMM